LLKLRRSWLLKKKGLPIDNLSFLTVLLGTGFFLVARSEHPGIIYHSPPDCF